MTWRYSPWITPTWLPLLPAPPTWPQLPPSSLDSLCPHLLRVTNQTFHPSSPNSKLETSIMFLWDPLKKNVIKHCWTKSFLMEGITLFQEKKSNFNLIYAKNDILGTPSGRYIANTATHLSWSKTVSVCAKHCIRCTAETHPFVQKQLLVLWYISPVSCLHFDKCAFLPWSYFTTDK